MGELWQGNEYNINIFFEKFKIKKENKYMCCPNDSRATDINYHQSDYSGTVGHADYFLFLIIFMFSCFQIQYIHWHITIHNS